MKKREKLLPFITPPSYQKIVKIMKLTCAFMLLACLHVSAGTYPQDRVSLKLNGTEIKQALNKYKEAGTNIKLSLVHVISNLPTSYFHIPSMVLLAKRYHDEEQKSLMMVGTELGVSKSDQWLITGNIRTEVLRLSRKLNSHFILAGAAIIKELHRSFLFKHKHNNTPIRNISTNF